MFKSKTDLPCRDVVSNAHLCQFDVIDVTGIVRIAALVETQAARISPNVKQTAMIQPFFSSGLFWSGPLSLQLDSPKYEYGSPVFGARCFVWPNEDGSAHIECR